MEQTEAHRGMRGYAEDAPAFIRRYEAIGFADKHEALLPLIPPHCSSALDVGAGAGGDAGWLAEQGYEVVAVEPTAEFRTYASKQYPSPRIEWIDDRLPDLRHITRRGRAFDLILISAVWMHLDADERSRAMPILASLLSPGGLLYMSVRHGPVPEGRTMFDVSAAETVASAEGLGLEAILNTRREAIQRTNREAGVAWSQFAFTLR